MTPGDPESKEKTNANQSRGRRHRLRQLRLLRVIPGEVQRAREKDPKYQYNLGLFYLNQSNVDNATKYFVKALALDTRYYLAWNAIGLAHSMKGRLDESVKAYQKCLEINPQFTEAHNNLGTVYQELKQFDQAEQEFKKALDRSHLSEPGAPLFQPGPALRPEGQSRRGPR